ncbi:hypothetical protein [Curtobacterium sp. MCSS17_016]|uniref:hypothetical protein n=1 Tax=Curtobacterium sp. MCSS17_016 TaxID=2175644 RepID=UPI000DAA91D5|nr:hypothetical protein [Curtobacterium sp. MCSS17_016]WIE81053.1 hypothetical protein DEJ19_021285 [Curtobacterium sp. MCSS17_016]
MPSGRTSRLSITVGAIVIVGLIGMTTANSTVASSPGHACTVTKKHLWYGKKGSVTRHIDTEDCGTLEVAHSFLHGELAPQWLYDSIAEGRTYRFTTYGRNFNALGLGLFPNIVKAVEVSK